MDNVKTEYKVLEISGSVALLKNLSGGPEPFIVATGYNGGTWSSGSYHKGVDTAYAEFRRKIKF